MSIGNREALKRAFSILTAVATILSLSGIAMIAPAVAATPADYGLKEGDVISAAGSSDPDVYIVNEHGYKRLFLNPAIFNFYGHLGGFSKVKTVTPAVRDAFMTSGLFRVDGDQKVYGVEVTGEDVAVLHWVNTTGAQAVADDPNFFKKVFVINQNEFNWYTKGSDYTSVNQIPAYTRGTTTPTPTTGSLSASLASDNPVSGTLVETQAMAPLAKFNVMGSGSVTSVELKRLGVSGDSTLTDVYLFVNGVRVSDSGNVSSGMITFANGSGLFSAPATLEVRATIADSKAGETVGVQLTKLNGSSVSVSGNLFTIAANSTLAGVAVGSPTGPGNFDPQSDVNVWQSTFTVTNEDVYLKRLTIREIGSIDNNHVTNLKLFVDGVQVATASGLNSDGYATFLANHRMTTGSRTVKVHADVVGGSSRTMQFSLRGYYDLDVMDEAYNVNVTATGTFPASASQSTVGSASVSAVLSNTSPTVDVVKDGTDVVLAKYTLTAYGEAIKIDTLAFRASASDSNIGSLRNGRILINGSQYGSTTSLSTTATTSFTVNYTLQPGTPATVEVKADIYDNASTNDVSADDVISVLFDGGDLNNAQGVSSASTVDVPASTIESNNLTVKVGSITLSKYSGFSNQTVSVPASNMKLGHFVLTGNSSEAVNINTIELGFDGGDQWTATQLNDVTVKYNGVTLTPKSTVSSSASSSWSVNLPLAVNQTVEFEVFGNVSNFTVAGSNDTMNVQMEVSGSTANSSTSVSSEAVGQTMTAGSGTFTTSIDSSAAKLVAGGSTQNGGVFRFRADNEQFTITELQFKVTSGSEDSVSSVVLKNSNGSTIQTLPLSLSSDDYVAKFAGLNIAVPANTEVTLSADVMVASIGTGGGSTGDNVKLTLDYAKYRNTSGTETTASTDREGANTYAHRAYPEVSKTGSLADTTLGAGDETFAQFSVSPMGGNSIGVKRIRFDITKSSGVGIASSAGQVKIYENGSEITSVSSISHSGLGQADTSGYVIVEFNSERTLSSATEYRLDGTISTWAADKSITVTVSQDSSNAAPALYGSVAASSKFTWTDRSLSGHSESTADWMNGYLVKNLPLSWGKTS